MSGDPSRRQYLRAVGVAGVAALAGCGSETGGGSAPVETTSVSTHDARPSFGGEPTVEVSGSGQRRIDPFTLSEGFTVFELAHGADEYFRTELLGVRGQTGGEPLTVQNQAFSGSYPMHVTGGEYELYVQGEGDWTVRVRQPDVSAVEWSQPPHSFRSSGPAYRGLVEFVGETRFHSAVTGRDVGAVHVDVLNRRGQRVERVGDVVTRSDTTVTDLSLIGWVRVAAQGGPWSVTIETVEPATDTPTDRTGETIDGERLDLTEWEDVDGFGDSWIVFVREMDDGPVFVVANVESEDRRYLDEDGRVVSDPVRFESEAAFRQAIGRYQERQS